jgi:hypothetical protein
MQRKDKCSAAHLFLENRNAFEFDFQKQNTPFIFFSKKKSMKSHHGAVQRICSGKTERHSVLIFKNKCIDFLKKINMCLLLSF